MLYTLPCCTALYVNYTSVKLGREFPGDPVVRMLSFQCERVGSIPGPELDPMPCGQKKNPQNINRNNIETNSLKTLKIIHLEKILKKKMVRIDNY